MDRPKHLAVFAQSTGWCEILGVQNAADLDRMMEEGRLREFIRVNEALHDKAIAAIADRIVALGARIILIAGPSSSGKTTFAQRLRVHLKVLGRHPQQLSLDNYYLDRDTLPREPDGSLDLESIHALTSPAFRSICPGCWRARRYKRPASASKRASGSSPPCPCVCRRASR